MRSTSGTGTDSAVPNIKPGRHLLRHLVDGARAVDVAAAERLQEHAVVEHGPEVVRVRIAEVRRDRVVAVRGADLTEPAVDLRERFVPRDLVPRLAARGSSACARGPDRLSSCLIAVPFGHRYPRLNTSSRSPRTERDLAGRRCAARARTSLRTGGTSGTRCSAWPKPTSTGTRWTAAARTRRCRTRSRCPHPVFRPSNHASRSQPQPLTTASGSPWCVSSSVSRATATRDAVQDDGPRAAVIGRFDPVARIQLRPVRGRAIREGCAACGPARGPTNATGQSVGR